MIGTQNDIEVLHTSLMQAPAPARFARLYRQDYQILMEGTGGSRAQTARDACLGILPTAIAAIIGIRTTVSLQVPDDSGGYLPNWEAICYLALFGILALAALVLGIYFWLAARRDRGRKSYKELLGRLDSELSDSGSLQQHPSQPQRKGPSTVVNTDSTASVADPFSPDAQIIYEWPSRAYPDPDVWWDVDDGAGQKRRVDGGQKITLGEGSQQVLRIENTAENANWQKRHSIMRLGPARRRDIRNGDHLTLELEVRAPQLHRLGSLGDGGRIETQEGARWCRVWELAEEGFAAGHEWRQLAFEVDASPAVPEYDAEAEGTTVYLTSDIGASVLEIRRIRLKRYRKS